MEKSFFYIILKIIILLFFEYIYQKNKIIIFGIKGRYYNE